MKTLSKFTFIVLFTSALTSCDSKKQSTEATDAKVSDTTKVVMAPDTVKTVKATTDPVVAK